AVRTAGDEEGGGHGYGRRAANPAGGRAPATAPRHRGPDRSAGRPVVLRRSGGGDRGRPRHRRAGGVAHHGRAVRPRAGGGGGRRAPRRRERSRETEPVEWQRRGSTPDEPRRHRTGRAPEPGPRLRAFAGYSARPSLVGPEAKLRITWQPGCLPWGGSWTTAPVGSGPRTGRARHLVPGTPPRAVPWWRRGGPRPRCRARVRAAPHRTDGATVRPPRAYSPCAHHPDVTAGGGHGRAGDAGRMCRSRPRCGRPGSRRGPGGGTGTGPAADRPAAGGWPRYAARHDPIRSARDRLPRAGVTAGPATDGAAPRRPR